MDGLGPSFGQDCWVYCTLLYKLCCALYSGYRFYTFICNSSYNFFCQTVVTDVMPKSPRKNPTPRKLLRLPSGELQQKVDADVKEEIESSTEDSLSAAVNEDTKPKVDAIDGSNSGFGRCAAATVAGVESTTEGKAVAGSRRRSTKQINTASPEDRGSTAGTQTRAKCSKKGSRYSKTKPKKVDKGSTKVVSKGGTECLITDEPSAVDSSTDSHGTNVCEENTTKTATEYCRNVQRTGDSIDRSPSVDSQEASDPAVILSTGTSTSVISTDSICKEDINKRSRTASELLSSDVMPTSAVCASSDAVKTADDHRNAVDGQQPAAEEPEGVYMPTPQKNQLRFLSEELFSLNQESAHITTHIHRRAGTTPRRDRNRAGGNRQSLSTPRKFNVLTSDSRSNSRSPRSTPRKTNSGPKTPWKVKFSFSTTPSKSEKKATKMPSSKKKSPCSSSVLTFPTPSKKQTKRKLYAESPDYDARKPAKMSRYALLMYIFKN